MFLFGEQCYWWLQGIVRNIYRKMMRNIYRKMIRNIYRKVWLVSYSQKVLCQLRHYLFRAFEIFLPLCKLHERTVYMIVYWHFTPTRFGIRTWDVHKRNLLYCTGFNITDSKFGLYSLMTALLCRNMWK